MNQPDRNARSVNNNPTDLNWMIDDLVAGVPSARHAAVLSGDGLLIQKSSMLSRDYADQLAAYTASLHSVAKGPGQMFNGGPVRQVVVEYLNGYLFVMSAGPNAYLAVYTEEDIDMGMIAYEMNRLVKRVGQYMKSENRATPVVMVDGSPRA